MSYTEIEKKCVVETIAKPATVIMCDFATMRMIDCKDMTLDAIRMFIEKKETKFFEAVANA